RAPRRARRARRPPPRDRLPPPPGGRFRSAVRPISAAVRARMGATWRPGCPGGPQGLPYVTVSFRVVLGRAPPAGAFGPCCGGRVGRRAFGGPGDASGGPPGRGVAVSSRLYRARYPIE